MKTAVASILVLSCATASADRLISIPQGNKIRFREVRLEGNWELRDRGGEQFYLGAGVTRDFEVEWHGIRERGGAIVGTLNLTYNFINPITDFAPGISVGVLDALDRTQDRRRGYFATTYRYGLDGENNQNVPMEVSLGVTVGEAIRPFVGVSLPT
ncbi:MAG TPA: hypothetical protein PKA27_07705 [Fimbriimonadaceae bacterium]|nr:hypothetical protein [Fimbriimonadaceae bacterium]